MKKALLLMVSSSIILAACGNDDEQKNLEQEIKSLEKSTKDYQKIKSL